MIVKSGRSRFVLATLAAADFRLIDDIAATREIRLAQQDARKLLEKTHFSMAQQDVRYYLNGCCSRPTAMRCARWRPMVTGSRCARSHTTATAAPRSRSSSRGKGVLELQRLLGDDDDVDLAIGPNHIRAEIGENQADVEVDRRSFPGLRAGDTEARGQPDASRAGILAVSVAACGDPVERKVSRGRLDLAPKSLKIQANNPDQEEAKDEIEVDYDGDEIEIGFNVNYLLDALSAVDMDEVELGFVDSNSSCVINGPGIEDAKFVVMPMRL